MTEKPMPLPDWYEEMKRCADDEDFTPKAASFQPPDLEKIEDFDNLFAEYEVQDDHLVMHLFPRAGMEDKWVDGKYINRCRNCRREVPMPKTKGSMIPCPHCGHAGLIYVPGRTEEKSKAAFPEGAEGVIKNAVSRVWAGDAAVELFPDLGAFAVQFQHAKTTVKVVGERKFVDQVCSAVNEGLTEG